MESGVIFKNKMRLQRHAAKLVRLKKMTIKNRKKRLKKELDDDDFVKCICECCKNILLGNVPLTSQQRSNLKKRKADVRRLANKKISLKSKKAIIQRGGFLGAILGPVVSVLGGLLGNVLGKK